ncbi:glycoside hydrolase family 30 protein [Flavobacterium muglaense]|nr:glycoside hydrolase family 30 beta sandwich domain-containing protein [Flavobacterium muglaense]
MMKNLCVVTVLIVLWSCSSTTNTVAETGVCGASSQMDFWLTKGNESVKLEKQSSILGFGSVSNDFSNIEVDDSKIFQTIDGFGYTLTGGSAQVINQLNTQKRKELLKELFGTGQNEISVSYVRISIGASDLDAMPFSYNDLPTGETDVNLEKFNLASNKGDVIPMLKEILAINPAIKIIATPWSPPIWMKDNSSFVGGSLNGQYYGVYAQYFVKYIQQMKAEGITIDAVTPQNEPLHPGNNPSLLMTAAQQADFIKNHLGPAFQLANLKTKIITYDHNCDKPEYPLALLNDAGAYPFIDGSAFHLYAGDIGALSIVHDSYPNKNVYFTEQYTSDTGSFEGDLKWHVKNVVIGSMRNWSKIALEWNLATNASFGPNTAGGCTTCKGALTIESSDRFTRNVAYYIIAHASKFVPAGSVRISSNLIGNLQNVAFKTPDGKKVLIVENDGDTAEKFNIKDKDNWFLVSLEAGSVGTYIW